MDKDRDPLKENEEVGRMNEEDVTSSADEEEFEEISETEEDEQDLES